VPTEYGRIIDVYGRADPWDGCVSAVNDITCRLLKFGPFPAMIIHPLFLAYSVFSKFWLPAAGASIAVGALFLIEDITTQPITIIFGAQAIATLILAFRVGSKVGEIEETLKGVKKRLDDIEDERREVTRITGVIDNLNYRVGEMKDQLKAMSPRLHDLANDIHGIINHPEYQRRIEQHEKRRPGD